MLFIEGTLNLIATVLKAKEDFDDKILVNQIQKSLYGVTFTVLFSLFVFAQFFIFKPRMLGCTNEVSIVDVLWNIAMFWSIIFYITLGCACTLGIIYAIEKAKNKSNHVGELLEDLL